MNKLTLIVLMFTPLLLSANINVFKPSTYNVIYASDPSDGSGIPSPVPPIDPPPDPPPKHDYQSASGDGTDIPTPAPPPDPPPDPPGRDQIKS